MICTNLAQGILFDYIQSINSNKKLRKRDIYNNALHL